VIINVDGLERQRKKWNRLGKLVYMISEWLVTFLPDAIVSDSLFIQKYYRDRYNKASTYIAYGGDLGEVVRDGKVNKYKLEKNRYILFVGRLEPENNAHLVQKAFINLKTDLKLVFLGDAPYGKKYIDKLKEIQDNRILFLGAIYGEDYRQLLDDCYFSVRASEVGGTHPALLEAMGYGKCVLVSDNPQNRETAGSACMLFRLKDKNDLKTKLQYLIDNPSIVKEYGEKAKERIAKYYTWDKVTDAYERLFKNV